MPDVLDDLSKDTPLAGINNLWFFFAGHGTIDPHDGNDYLLLLDSNLNLLEETAISTNRILHKRTAIVMDQEPIHTSGVMQDQLLEPVTRLAIM